MLAFFKSFNIRSEKAKKAVLILLVTIWGSTIQLTEGMDGHTLYMSVYREYINMPFSYFFDGVLAILKFQKMSGVKGDMYIHLLSYFTGSFLNMPGLFFPIVAFIYGYFYINGIFKILNIQPLLVKSNYAIYFLIVFVVYCGIENMQSIRSWTGLWVLFNGVVGFFQTRKLRYLILILIPPLIHSMFFIIILPVIPLMFFKKIPLKIITAAFFISFLVSLPSMDILEKISGTELGQEKASIYYKDDAERIFQIEEYQGQTYLHKILGKRGALTYGSIAIAILFIVSGAYFINMNSAEKYIFSVGLVLMTLANLFDFIPAFMSRASYISFGYIIAAALMLARRGALFKQSYLNPYMYKILIILILFLFYFRIQYAFLMYMYGSSVFIFVFPWLVWLNENLRYSIREGLDFIFEFLGW